MEHSFLLDSEEDFQETYVKSKVSERFDINFIKNIQEQYLKCLSYHPHLPMYMSDFNNYEKDFEKGFELYDKYSCMLEPYKIRNNYTDDEYYKKIMTALYRGDSTHVFGCFNFDDFITLLDSNNNEFSLSELTKNSDVQFIKISKLYYRQAIIDTYISVNPEVYDFKMLYYWQDDSIQIQDDHIVNADANMYDGYSNTLRIYKKYLKNKSLDIQAINACIEKNMKINNVKYNCYLPSVLEMDFIFICYPLIKYVYKVVNGTDVFPNNTSNGFWTSSEYDKEHVWYACVQEFQTKVNHTFFKYGKKIYRERKIFPCFKRIP